MNKHTYIYKIIFLFFIPLLFIVLIFLLKTKSPVENTNILNNDNARIISGKFDTTKTKDDATWKEILTPEQYHILREGGTETPFTGALNSEKRSGTYYSVGCDKPLFRSEQKYDSKTGWPSFWRPITDEALVLRKESGIGDNRVEVLDTCGGHLGHVFDDGPAPTYKRYCINSLALEFIPDERQAAFAIFTNGTFRIFTSNMYHNLSEDVYIDAANPNIINIKKAETTWSDFFDTLPFSLDSTCLTTGTKQTFCTGDGGELKFYLNGEKKENVLDEIIKPDDELLVTFGNESEEEIQRQISY